MRLAALALATVATGCSALYRFDTPPPDAGSPEDSGPPPVDRCTIGRFGGQVDDVALEGDFAFVASGGFVRAVDVSDPTAPHEIDAYALDVSAGGDGSATAVEAVGAFVYVGTNRGRLILLDAGNPTDLTRNTFATAPPGVIFDIAPIDDRFVLVTIQQEDGSSWLRLADLDIGTFTLDGTVAGLAFGLAIHGGEIAVGAGAGGVAFFLGATHPDEGGIADTDGVAMGVVPLGPGWLVADLTDLVYVEGADAVPDPILSGDEPGLEDAEILDVATYGGYGYVAAGGAGLVVVSLPVDVPRVIDRERGAAPALRVVAHDTLAYVATGEEGLHVIDTACLRE